MEAEVTVHQSLQKSAQQLKQCLNWDLVCEQTRCPSLFPTTGANAMVLTEHMPHPVKVGK